MENVQFQYPKAELLLLALANCPIETDNRMTLMFNLHRSGMFDPKAFMETVTDADPRYEFVQEALYRIYLRQDQVPITFGEFYDTLRVWNPANYAMETGLEVGLDAIHVFSFLNMYHIVAYNNMTFELSVLNKQYESQNFLLLAHKLWDEFVKHEMKLSPTMLEDDLHDRAKQFVHVIGLNCSLDEVNLKMLTPQMAEFHAHLLKQFDII